MDNEKIIKDTLEFLNKIEELNSIMNGFLNFIVKDLEIIGRTEFIKKYS